MDKNKIIQYKSGSVAFNEKTLSLDANPKSNNNMLRKAKGFPSATSIWNNSIYSFNKNYLKNIPAVDNIVNKIIKSFFTIEALVNNPKGKKSRLIQRRYKRLSLNKILVSKSEVKHTNDKVFVTVYLFNKKKKSLILNLKEGYENLVPLLTLKNINTVINSNIEPKKSNISTYSEEKKVLDVNAKKGFGKKEFLGLVSNQNTKKNVITDYKLQTLDYMLNNINNKTNLIIGNSSANHDADFSIIHKLLSEDMFKKYAYLGDIYDKSEDKSFKTSDNSKYNNIHYYKNLNNLAKFNIHKFITSLETSLQSHSNRKSNGTNLKDLYKFLRNTIKDVNKYKLYNSINIPSNLNYSSTYLETYYHNLSSLVKKSNYSIYKLNSLNKLFTLYNNIILQSNNSNLLKESDLTLIYSNKILLNLNKLLKKLYINPSQLEKGKIWALPNKPINENIKNLAGKNTKSYINLKNTMKDVIIINKLNRIDKFFDKYRNIFINNVIESQNKDTKGLNKYVYSFGNLAMQRVISNYKINFINESLEKELLYIYYLKLLSYNNVVFKNWFLYSLKNLLSKIYNKKVVLNLVNLKYIHLNSDIFTQAVNIRLRNFKKNKVVNVLKKAIKLVPISKVNIYACDEHSSMYKYIHNYYNKFKTLKLDIFKELNMTTDSTKSEDISTYTYKSAKIKRLNHIQTSTINFIKYKSVFGARLEAVGRLSKRSTASRSVFKFRYNGTLRNNPIINNSVSSVIIKDNRISNLQFTKISSKTRNGSFGIKGWINSN